MLPINPGLPATGNSKEVEKEDEKPAKDQINETAQRILKSMEAKTLQRLLEKNDAKTFAIFFNVRIARERLEGPKRVEIFRQMIKDPAISAKLSVEDQKKFEDQILEAVELMAFPARRLTWPLDV
jgi:putative ubiquitin-RnfH superfamily antitoxin RatB of RatAB toxin-antitoxin module